MFCNRAGGRSGRGGGRRKLGGFKARKRKHRKTSLSHYLYTIASHLHRFLPIDIHLTALSSLSTAPGRPTSQPLPQPHPSAAHPNNVLLHCEVKSSIRILRGLVGDNDSTTDEKNLISGLAPRSRKDISRLCSTRKSMRALTNHERRRHVCPG